MFELDAGHSESDVVVYLPEEKIVFCGDIFINSMPPLPGEGHVTETIINYKATEAKLCCLEVKALGLSK